MVSPSRSLLVGSGTNGTSEWETETCGCGEGGALGVLHFPWLGFMRSLPKLFIHVLGLNDFGWIFGF